MLMPMSLIRKKIIITFLFGDYLLAIILIYQSYNNIVNYSGIDLTHPEFEGRAKFGYDSVDNPPRQDDPNGHGTHVAGEKLIRIWVSLMLLVAIELVLDIDNLDYLFRISYTKHSSVANIIVLCVSC